MKKIFYILLIMTISICMAACGEDPYTGKYQSSDNTILILNANNNCTIINNVYKEAFYIKGKYVIENNNINITFDSKQGNYYGLSKLKGKFEGSRIQIYDSLGSKYCIFSKE